MDSSKVIVLWRGDRFSPDAPTRYGERLAPVLVALRAVGLTPAPVIHFDARPEATRAQLRGAAAVLVWINPIADGEDRRIVDALLREAADAGALVSAHPDVIAKMGVKRVLWTTRTLGWAADTALYESAEAFAARFPQRIARGTRVLKPNRGNDGRGVLKVTAAGDGFRVQHAFDDSIETLDFAALGARVAPAFAAGGGVVDQAWQAATGMVRVYMSADRVVGFGEQGLRRRADGFAMDSAKAMHGPDHAPRADLRALTENDWTPGLLRLLALAPRDLPVLWDADFLLTAGGYRLCEINVSCVSPFPPAAPRAIAEAVRARLCG